jgi:hypothetical protein
MKTKLLAVFVLSVLILSCFWIFKVLKQEPLSTPQSAETPTSFALIPVIGFSSSNVPCIDAQIEKEKFVVELDSGYDGDISLQNSLVQKLTEKTFAGTTWVRGFRGNRYQKNAYNIPRITIGGMSFSDRVLEEENEDLQKESMIIKRKDGSDFHIVGKVGWKLLNRDVLFLDLRHSTIALCDSIETFQKKGHPLERFVKTPLLIERNLIEFKATTPNGPLRCFLDTGSTINLLNVENPNEQPLEKITIDEKNLVNFPAFQIDGKDFGMISFHTVPLRFPIHVEAILGMEFLSNHQVLIDFKNLQIYFSESP